MRKGTALTMLVVLLTAACVEPAPFGEELSSPPDVRETAGDLRIVQGVPIPEGRSQATAIDSSREISIPQAWR